MDEMKIKSMLERYGVALSTGDLQGIASCWEVPALVISDQGAIAVTDAGQVEEFFGQAFAWYQAQGMTSTRPEVRRVEGMSDRLAGVDVRWPSFDATGEEVFSEVSHYILYLGQDDQLRIRVALTRTM